GAVGKKIVTRRNNRYLLNGGMMRCSVCNSHMIGWVRGSGCRPVYVCGGYKNRTTACQEYFTIDSQELDGAVVVAAQEFLSGQGIENKIAEFLQECDLEIR